MLWCIRIPQCSKMQHVLGAVLKSTGNNKKLALRTFAHWQTHNLLQFKMHCPRGFCDRDFHSITFISNFACLFLTDIAVRGITLLTRLHAQLTLDDGDSIDKAVRFFTQPSTHTQHKYIAGPITKICHHLRVCLMFLNYKSHVQYFPVVNRSPEGTRWLSCCHSELSVAVSCFLVCEPRVSPRAQVKF